MPDLPLSAAGYDVDAVIVGAGFSGLYMLHRLRDLLGLTVRCFEAGDGVGGTWYWNRYPGARCDSESTYYSYSFSEDLQQEWTWSTKYPEQPEILLYLNHVADRFDLRSDITFGTRVTAATFLDGSDSWEVRTDNDEVVMCRFLISAVGCLSAANIPSVPGLDRFQGDRYHTGAWPHHDVSFSEKRVGLIGTGSSGIQATPVIAAEADHLYVFQRTPNYSIPARNRALSNEEWDDIKAHYGQLRRKCRDSWSGFPYDRSELSALAVSPEEREARYERLWAEEGGFKFLFGSFNDFLTNQDANDTVAEFIRRKIHEIVKDQAVAGLLSPRDYPYGTKRPPIDTAYYETFNRDNVTLVDLRETPIVEITPTGLRTSDRDYRLGVIVFATGFDAMTGSLLRIDVHGKQGVSLREKWADGPVNYLGIQVAGFPNMFIITGPGSPSVLANMPTAIEQHVEWITDCIAYMRERDLTRVDASEDAQAKWVEHVQAVADTTLFPKANSWYVGANIPGKKRVFMPYVGGFGPYDQLCKDIALNGYQGFVLSGQ
jgi:cation diffusion facilitator CzcD-associated flavoprotein CzcO